MERMILRYGRIASNATRHVTLLRGGINKATALLWKVVSQRITRDRDTGELISWDVGCQRMSKAKLHREIPGGPRNNHVAFVTTQEKRQLVRNDDKVPAMPLRSPEEAQHFAMSHRVKNTPD